MEYISLGLSNDTPRMPQKILDRKSLAGLGLVAYVFGTAFGTVGCQKAIGMSKEQAALNNAYSGLQLFVWEPVFDAAHKFFYGESIHQTLVDQGFADPYGRFVLKIEPKAIR